MTGQPDDYAELQMVLDRVGVAAGVWPAVAHVTLPTTDFRHILHAIEVLIDERDQALADAAAYRSYIE